MSNQPTNTLKNQAPSTYLKLLSAGLAFSSNAVLAISAGRFGLNELVVSDDTLLTLMIKASLKGWITGTVLYTLSLFANAIIAYFSFLDLFTTTFSWERIENKILRKVTQCTAYFIFTMPGALITAAFYSGITHSRFLYWTIFIDMVLMGWALSVRKNAEFLINIILFMQNPRRAIHAFCSACSCSFLLMLLVKFLIFISLSIVFGKSCIDLLNQEILPNILSSDYKINLILGYMFLCSAPMTGIIGKYAEVGATFMPSFAKQVNVVRAYIRAGKNTQALLTACAILVLHVLFTFSIGSFSAILYHDVSKGDYDTLGDLKYAFLFTACWSALIIHYAAAATFPFYKKIFQDNLENEFSSVPTESPTNSDEYSITIDHELEMSVKSREDRQQAAPALHH